MRSDRLATLPYGRRGLLSALVLALTLVATAAPEPLASGPRPAVSTYVGPSDATTPPEPWVDHRFTTLPFQTHAGVPGTWVLTREALPLQLSVEQELVERFGLDVLRDTLEVWNDTDGSTFEVSLAYLTDDRADSRRRDGVNRVFLDRTSCEDRYLARAHLYPANVEIRDDRSVAWVEEVDIGICERLSPERLASVLRHEVAHVAGLGHLCDTGADCWRPEMSEDNRCRVMSPASYTCQEPNAGDRDGLVYLHPVVPRVGATGAIATGEAVARYSDPLVQRADRLVLVPVDADPDLQAAAAALAGTHGLPLVPVDQDCTTGPDGRAINRTASVAAHVLLVGEVSRGCEDSLTIGWELTAERLPDLRAIAAAMSPEAGARRVVVVPRHEGDDEWLPVSAMAAPIAARLSAPLVPVGRDGVDGAADDLLAAAPDATVAVVVGGPRFVPTVVERELEARGLRVRRLPANERSQLAVELSKMRDVFGGPGPIGAVLVPAAPNATVAPAAALAARTGRTVLPVSDARHRLVLDALGERLDDALLVGGPEELSVDLQLAVSRIVDR